ncbi:hypothetical protein H072_7581 [Dactylellina haptotyla CBS 200.50]|uniref:Uncharacterized protein n=1 Tax=Dactylellina haptotyla (strain CBS 200.50) TaxID=1284197 RepID=S8A6N1_DACHA|nr:hypothetical protein H072_7581 [Dactylellina haptotyla CBS 200.50]
MEPVSKADMKVVVSAAHKMKQNQDLGSYVLLEYNNLGKATNPIGFETSNILKCPRMETIFDTSEESSECSSISDIEEFDPVPVLMGATVYPAYHIQPKLFCKQEELRSGAKKRELEWDERDLRLLNLTKWKLQSIRDGGEEIVRFEGDSVVVPQVPKVPGSKPYSLPSWHRPRFGESLDATRNDPSAFYPDLKGWKKQAVENDCFILLEITPGYPPQCAIWEDVGNIRGINTTDWLSANADNSIYSYDIIQSSKKGLGVLWPNQVCRDSIRCVRQFILVSQPNAIHSEEINYLPPLTSRFSHEY